MTKKNIVDWQKTIALAPMACPALLTLLMYMLPMASGQSVTGWISGTVLDQQSATVAGATSALINELTGQARSEGWAARRSGQGLLRK
jgi:hypothetical protein